MSKPTRTQKVLKLLGRGKDSTENRRMGGASSKSLDVQPFRQPGSSGDSSFLNIQNQNLYELDISPRETRLSLHVPEDGSDRGSIKHVRSRSQPTESVVSDLVIREKKCSLDRLAESVESISRALKRQLAGCDDIRKRQRNLEGSLYKLEDYLKSQSSKMMRMVLEVSEKVDGIQSGVRVLDLCRQADDPRVAMLLFSQGTSSKVLSEKSSEGIDAKESWLGLSFRCNWSLVALLIASVINLITCIYEAKARRLSPKVYKVLEFVKQICFAISHLIIGANSNLIWEFILKVMRWLGIKCRSDIGS